MAIFEIPLSPQPQVMAIALAGVNYRLRLHYANVDQGGWLLDIGDASGNPLICGIPLVTGADLLAQYPDIGIGGKLFVSTDGDPNAVPTFENLGLNAHLYFVPEQLTIAGQAMRVRALSPTGDMTFGRGLRNFYINDKRGVAQNVKTRLGLYLADWFLDTSAGTAWRTQVLGLRTDATRDATLRARILGTPGVTQIVSYASQFDHATRIYAVQCTIDTAYGQTTVSTSVAAPNGDVRDSR